MRRDYKFNYMTIRHALNKAIFSNIKTIRLQILKNSKLKCNFYMNIDKKNISI